MYCGSGYRASIAASVLDRPGREVVLVNDAYGTATEAGLEDDRLTEGAGAPQRTRHQLTSPYRLHARHHDHRCP